MKTRVEKVSTILLMDLHRPRSALKTMGLGRYVDMSLTHSVTIDCWRDLAQDGKLLLVLIPYMRDCLAFRKAVESAHYTTLHLRKKR
jgi:hypothetical protein